LRFTVRRPPNSEVSPCSHRPSGGNISCSVHIGVAPASAASFALEDRLALAVSGSDMPTRGATLRRIRGRDLLDPAQSLVLQTRDKQAPATSADRTVEPTFLGDFRAGLLDGAARRAGHRPHIKSFDPDHIEPRRQDRSGFLHPVLAPIPLTGFELRDRTFRLRSAIGTTSTTGEPLLQHRQPLRLTRSQPGCVQQFAGRQRGRHGNTAVNTHHASIARPGDRVGDARERNMPAASPIAGNPVGLDSGWHRSRQAKAHRSNLWHPDPTKMAVQPLDVMRFQPDLSKPFVYTGLAPSRVTMRAGEEVAHGLRKIPQRLLLHRLTPGSKPRVLGTRFCQLRALLHIAGSLATRLPMRLLLHRQIPHKPRVTAVSQQRLLLLRARQQAVPRHTRTVITGTDIHRRRTLARVGIGILPALTSEFSSRRSLR
jgi:hypothetical protein